MPILGRSMQRQKYSLRAFWVSMIVISAIAALSLLINTRTPNEDDKFLTQGLSVLSNVHVKRNNLLARDEEVVRVEPKHGNLVLISES